MIRLKAFGVFPPLSNNDPNVINANGELSTYAETYASDHGQFSLAAYPHSQLAMFVSQRDTGPSTTVYVDPPSTAIDLMLSICEWVYARSIAGDIANDRGSFLQALATQFTNTQSAQNFDCGSMGRDARFWMPAWISFKAKADQEDYEAKIWFQDLAFRQQFDNYEIRIVAPTAKIDDFFGSPETVRDIVAKATLTEVMLKVQTVANSQPYTSASTEQFEWVNPQSSEQKIVVPWTFVVYGEAGLSLDAQKKTLIDWILANSKYGEDQWAKIFPDIFGATEYLFIPTWSHYAIPSQLINTGVFSPGNNPALMTKLAKALMQGVGYTDEHVTRYLNYVGTAYKNLPLLALGGPRNRDKIYEFTQRWPDYIAVGTGNADFSRMSEATENFVMLLTKLLQIAETMTASSDMPHGFLRVVRNDVMYVAATIERTQLLVASKQSVEAVEPPFIGGYQYQVQPS